jgi:hypothetical protein
MDENDGRRSPPGTLVKTHVWAVGKAAQNTFGTEDPNSI